MRSADSDNTPQNAFDSWVERFQALKGIIEPSAAITDEEVRKDLRSRTIQAYKKQIRELKAESSNFFDVENQALYEEINSFLNRYVSELSPEILPRAMPPANLNLASFGGAAAVVPYESPAPVVRAEPKAPKFMLHAPSLTLDKIATPLTGEMPAAADSFPFPAATPPGRSIQVDDGQAHGSHGRTHGSALTALPALNLLATPQSHASLYDPSPSPPAVVVATARKEERVVSPHPFAVPDAPAGAPVEKKSPRGAAKPRHHLPAEFSRLKTILEQDVIVSYKTLLSSFVRKYIKSTNYTREKTVELLQNNIAEFEKQLEANEFKPERNSYPEYKGSDEELLNHAIKLKFSEMLIAAGNDIRSVDDNGKKKYSASFFSANRCMPRKDTGYRDSELYKKLAATYQKLNPQGSFDDLTAKEPLKLYVAHPSMNAKI